MLRPQIERYLLVHGVPWRLVPMEEESRFLANEELETASAKGVLVEVDSGDEVICVVPVTAEVDLDALCDLLQVRDAVVCEAGRILELFPGCDIGRAPPFAGLWNLPVILDARVERTDRMLVPAGNHRELLELRTDDFVQLEEPLVAEISSLPGEPWRHAMPAGAFVPAEART